jgi:tRNA1(Val) A37 N6-methylase TrmN6
MPSKNTFSIIPISQLIERYIEGVSIDPFANKSKLATYTNDIDPQYETTHNLNAIDFIKSFADSSIDCVLFDPPYSPRQLAECYKSLNKSVTFQDTQAKFWSDAKKAISNVLKPGGIAICCGWNSGGIGKKYGFRLIEVLMVPHGGQHNDTIVTVEVKKKTLFDGLDEGVRHD